ncbi:MAG TPA: gliding motility-associated C-terminal domain-containing protein, partial [Puia sp.]|nr:gliding motility-associated C-terminal domain-containing protein [Puia sp.]
FRPVAAGVAALKFFRIYNRSGELMYSTSQLGQGWDGTSSGKPQVAGTYVWMLEGVTYAGKLIQKRGTVILIR